jgi:hypothetical protein
MPIRSKAQQRYLYAHFGKAWVDAHHFDQSSKGLPNHVDKKRHKTKNHKKG